MISDTLKRTALDRLNQGFELHLNRRDPRWQMQGRRSIRFPVDYGNAEAIYQTLRVRFHTRCPTGSTRILTPEPRDSGGPGIAYYAEVRQEEEDVRLTAKWYTIHALSQATGLSKHKLSVAAHESTELFTRLEEAPEGYPHHAHGDMVTIYANEALATYLEGQQLKGGIHHAACDLSFDGTPDHIVLRRPWYTFQQIADVLSISYKAVWAWNRKNPEILTVEKRRVPGAQKKALSIRVDAALVDTIRTVWKHPDVAIAEDFSYYDRSECTREAA